MYVGFDTEYGFRVVRTINGRPEPDATTGVPVCACLAFEDGRREVFVGNFERLGSILADPRYEFVIHGAHAEMQFCRLAGLRFPSRYRDTLLQGVLLAHATWHKPIGGAYKQAGLAAVASRFGIPFLGVDEKDAIRDSILRLRHESDYGMRAVSDYCMADAQACLRLAPCLAAQVNARCGPNALKNLEVLFQPYSREMAAVADRGLRFDQEAWGRLLDLSGAYRERLLRVMRNHGYNHSGEGLGEMAFERLIQQVGLAHGWPRTAMRQLKTDEAVLKDRRHLHPAIGATYKLLRFDALMRQRLGERVDRDGRLRCGILPFAQRTSRTSTVRPNLMGLPGALRPLLLPDDGCKFLHFDFSQQEPAIAGYLSRDAALMEDFANGDVYLSLGRRMGVITESMTEEVKRSVRNGLLKVLMLSVMYGKGVEGIARDLRCSLYEAKLHLTRFAQTYPDLFAWLRAYVSISMERGWAENIVGYRAAFKVLDTRERSHIARSCQNFPIQSSAAACFQLTGVYLSDYGADIRMPIHDAYLILQQRICSCPDFSFQLQCIKPY